VKYTCPTCGGVITANHRRALDNMVIIHRGNCPGYKKKDEKA
jgi:ribosomal protein S27AE